MVPHCFNRQKKSRLRNLPRLIEGQHRSLGLMRHANVIEIDDDYALTIYAAGHVLHACWICSQSM